MVVLGHNDHLAWSLTNVMLDDTDFFEEAVNPDNPTEYLLDSLAGEPFYESFEQQQEIIPVKNEDDTVFTRRLTKHGPVISDIYPDQQLIGDRVITMKWTGHDVSKEVEALLGMNWAQSFEAFRRHGRNFKVPGQHFIYADRNDNIARLALGNVPIRDNNPILFRKGWDPSQDWIGYVPYEELPSEINPTRGWVGNANQKPVNDDYPYYLSIYWEDNARYDRITQYMTENEELSPEIFQQMQNDSRSLYANKLMDQILPVLKKSPDRFDTVISYL
jgi:penicillin amidase